MNKKGSQSFAAVVVTYNRREELKKQIECIVNEQSYKVDAYYIVDNNSADGTAEMVSEYLYNSTIPICYECMSENLGGAGGFSFGIEKAFNDGYDWVIAMDDDGRPKKIDCIEQIVKKINELEADPTDKYIINALVSDENGTLTFGLFSPKDTIESCKAIAKNGLILGKIAPFNCTFISRGLISEIGGPNKDFFIWGDETDYARRAEKAGSKLITVVDALYYHPRARMLKSRKFFGKEIYDHIQPAWKEYYNVRNQVYSFLQLKNKKAARQVFVKRLFFCIIDKCNKRETLSMIIHGYKDGCQGKLGAIVYPGQKSYK